MDAILAAADAVRPPLRLALGSGAYASIAEALAARQRELEANKAITLSVDMDSPAA